MQTETIEQKARFAAKSLIEGGSVMLSDESIRAMAEFINGPSTTQGLTVPVGSCPICCELPGQCIKSLHGYESKPK